jgi:fluoride exporter
MDYVWVALGGAIGSATRYGVTVGATRLIGGGFPWATLFVNIVGCFAMGSITALMITKMPEDVSTRLFLTTGVLGGFTTFSAFSLDFFGLVQRGHMLMAVSYALASVVLSIIAVFMGFRAFA